MVFVDSFFWCHDQFFHSRADVHLLRTVVTGTTHAEVPRVEEVLNPHPTGSYLAILPTHLYVHSHFSSQ